MTADRAGPRYFFRREFFGGVLYDLRNYEYVFCDAPIADALVARAPRSVAGLVPAGARDRASTLWRPDGTLNYEVLDTQPVDDWLSAPLQVYYDMSTLCNLRCPHCYTRSGPTKPRPGELSFEEIVAWADELAGQGVFKISIGGGEPLFHPQAEEIFRTFRERNISVSLSTHGLLFESGKWATVLNDLDMRTVTVSVEGGIEDSYEAIRGKGNWRRFLASMMRFRDDYRGRYAVRVTITRHTIGQVREILELGRQIGAYAVKFKFLQLGGRARDNEWLFPSHEQSVQVIREALELSERLNVKVTVPRMFALGTTDTAVNRYYPLTTTGEMPFEPTFGCGGGRIGIYVHPNGDYSACVSMGPDYASGNVRRNSLREAWLNGSGFKRMRALQGQEPCLSCKFLAECRGGCRARALAVFDDANAVDPYCPLVDEEKKAAKRDVLGFRADLETASR